MGSACAPLPRSSSVNARCDMEKNEESPAILRFAQDDKEPPAPSSVQKFRSPPREILLLQHPPMVQLVPRNDISQRPHAHFILVGNSTPHPSCLIQISQQRQRRPPNRNVVLNDLRELRCRKRTILHIIILLEALD